MRHRRAFVAISFLALLMGCGGQSSGVATAPAGAQRSPNNAVPVFGSALDPDQLRDADVSILFFGNSHTFMHDLPGLVRDLMIHANPGEKKVYVHLVTVGYLEDLATGPAGREALEAGPWKFVVLQAQKISMSGRYEYSRREGIDFAKLAKERGAQVVFFSEWGRKGIAADGERHEKVYREMAQAAGARVAAIGRAWDLALAERPDLALQAADGNHQSEVGAFLTACVLYGAVTGASPEALADFPYQGVQETDRAFLARTAARALAP
jgi:hypothetical protein